MKQIDMSGMPFAQLRERDKYYVDKTMLIADILRTGDSNVYLFTRPRRFGKSTNLSMLDAFFNIEYRGNTWFEGLQISEHSEFDEYRNAFPVINLNLKSAQAESYDRFLDGIRSAVLKCYRSHDYLFEQKGVADELLYIFDTLKTWTTPETPLIESIRILTTALAKYHNKRVVILVDEYDRAVTNAFGKDPHKKILAFLRDFLGSSLKDTNDVQMAYITGITQIAEESIFSGLNNVCIYNIFSEEFGERFGFTETEVAETLGYFGHPEKMTEAREWYDGYRFGKAEVYNPFSIMMYILKGFKADQYWANTGSDVAIRWLLDRIDDQNLGQTLSLIDGGEINSKLKATLVFSNIGRDGSALYSIMAMSGYIKAVPCDNETFNVSIPNKEVKKVLDELLDNLRPVNNQDFVDFNQAVLDCNADRMAYTLEKILLGGSYLNLNIENAYGLILMTVMHSLLRRYTVRTEVASGNGRTDIVLIPKNEGVASMIFELKKVNSEDELNKGLDDAIKQIHDRRYYRGMPGKVILVGIAFWIKIPRVRIEVIENGLDGLSFSE